MAAHCGKAEGVAVRRGKESIMRYPIFVPAVLACCAISAAGAQTLPKMPGGMPSMAGAGLPNLSSVGIPNAAGVLGYCVQHKYLSGASTNNVLGGLLKTPGVKAKPEYNAGAAGKIITGHGEPFSLSSVPGPMQDQACDLMLNQGSKLLKP
jgi:hypothetical protein